MTGTRADWSWKKALSLFLAFCRIGPVTFGGGFAMIPLIEKEIVGRRKWLASEEVTDVFAVAQSIPGAVAINAATIIGYRRAGVVGAIAALLGVLLPTFLIVLFLSMIVLHVQQNPMIEAAFKGIDAAIVAIILYAGMKTGKTAVQDKMTLAVVIATVLALFFTNVHPVFIILFGFFLGMVMVSVRGWLGLKTSLVEQPPEENEWGYMNGDGI
ncbi:chromate transporter [Paenibacillus thermotolerans]|uniref:chromate transporter n=1 Tax=Paenibacillus thermotolerans TaxID=3027807 RepID=UPI002368ACEC|nr:MULTISPECIES: chromate transporter [unclassified Paenibacillus]